MLLADTGVGGLHDVTSVERPVVGLGSDCNAPSSPPDDVTAEVLRRMNADRTAAGVPALAWNPQLFCLAVEWSAVQGDANTLSHRDLTDVIRSPEFERYQTLGENLLRGPATTDGARMHDEWMNSAPHRANVMNPAYTSVAIAVHYVEGGKVYATENFAG